MVINTSHGFKLVEGIGGRRWDTKVVIGKVLNGGSLHTVTAIDALRLALHIGFVTPLLGSLLFYVINSQINGSTETTALIGVFAFLGSAAEFYHYCRRFLLHRNLYRVLWLSVLTVFVGTLLLIDRFLTLPEPIITLPTPFDRIAYGLVLPIEIFSLPSLAAYVVAYIVFRFRLLVNATHRILPMEHRHT